MLKDASKRPNCPSAKEVEKYLKIWNSNDSSVMPEKSLGRLFQKTYPKNTELEEVLIKVSALNNLYSLRILSPLIVAKHIIKAKIDMNISKDDLIFVNKVAKVRVSENRTINFYSFATKYCSFSKPTIYPIYDSYVRKSLRFFEKKCLYTQT